MRRLMPFVMAGLTAAACGGGAGGTATDPTPLTSGVIGPPPGATTWTVTYRPATVATCPAQTPDSGSATMTADASGTSLSLTDRGTSLSAGGAATIVFNRDGSGRYLWTDPTGFATISFRFTTTSHAEGEAMRLPSPSLPCSATWPFLLDRQ